MTVKEAECLGQEKVYWPADNSCRSLLERGPCGEAEWLVVRGRTVSCQPRRCPCDPGAPELCEVELKGRQNSSCGDRCVVGRAAVQEGLCAPGEELLVSPGGWGECGCQTQPPHLTWPQDGRCYSVFTRGPCQPGQVLVLGEEGEPTCEEAECGEGEVEGEGECFPLADLGHRGPCPPQHSLALDQLTLRPLCQDSTNLERVFDLIPRRGLVRFGPLPGNRRLQQNCRLDRNGKCRKTLIRQPGGNSIDRRSYKVRAQHSPRQYLRWLNNFRRRKTL